MCSNRFGRDAVSQVTGPLSGTALVNVQAVSVVHCLARRLLTYRLFPWSIVWHGAC